MSRVKIDFGSVSQSVGLGPFWPGGSKQPAIETLLEKTLELRRDKFCPLMVKIVQEGLKYRQRSGKPITQEELHKLNKLIERLRFKIPELNDPIFIANLPTDKKEKLQEVVIPNNEKQPAVSLQNLKKLSEKFLAISSRAESQNRGFAFEKFLYDLFDVYSFNPRPSFRLVGEQIDGSIEFEHEIYLIEAKWQSSPVNQADLAVLDSRVSGHSSLGRGIFITAGCFSENGILAHQRLRPSSMIGIDGRDLYFILERGLPLDEALRCKLRHLVETGNFHYPILEFLGKLEHKSMINQ